MLTTLTPSNLPIHPNAFGVKDASQSIVRVSPDTDPSLIAALQQTARNHGYDVSEVVDGGVVAVGPQGKSEVPDKRFFVREA